MQHLEDQLRERMARDVARFFNNVAKPGKAAELDGTVTLHLENGQLLAFQFTPLTAKEKQQNAKKSERAAEAPDQPVHDSGKQG